MFRPIFQEETFDLVIANGVLHHTSDPFGGFKSIFPLVKKVGCILVGLYNKFGRLMTDLRRVIFRAIGKLFILLDPYLRETGEQNTKTEAWFKDQYQHPHESKHTMGEVLRWFDETDFRFLNNIPFIMAIRWFSRFSGGNSPTRMALLREGLFDRQILITWFLWKT